MVYMRSLFDQCLACGARPGPLGLCPACITRLPRNLAHCRQCALPLPGQGLLCADCQRNPPPFDRAHVPFLYRWPFDELLGAFKHRRQLFAGRLLAELVLDALPAPPAPDIIVPVPLQRTRLVERGFNQAGELARHVSRATGVPVAHDILRRVRAGRRQQGAGRAERLRNMTGAFQATRPCRAGRVLLVDDVVTTGATCRAAGLALRGAGAGEIEILAVARTPEPAS